MNDPTDKEIADAAIAFWQECRDADGAGNEARSAATWSAERAKERLVRLVDRRLAARKALATASAASACPPGSGEGASCTSDEAKAAGG